MAKLTVSKSEASDLLVAVGMLVARKWETDKLQDKLQEFDKMSGVTDKLNAMEEGSPIRKVGKRVLAALKQGANIVVADVPVENPVEAAGSKPEEGDVETTKTKPEKPGKKPVKPVKPAAKAEKKEKPTKEPKEATKKDAWGTREGTRTARINAVLLTGKAKTTAEIEAEADAHGIHSHLSKLKAAGWIEVTSDGKYKATAAGLALKAPKKVKK